MLLRPARHCAPRHVGVWLAMGGVAGFVHNHDDCRLLPQLKH